MRQPHPVLLRRRPSHGRRALVTPAKGGKGIALFGNAGIGTPVDHRRSMTLSRGPKRVQYPHRGLCPLHRR